QEQTDQTNSQPQVLQEPVQPPAPQTEPEDDVLPPQTTSPDTASSGTAWMRVVAWTAGGLGIVAVLVVPVLAVLIAKARRRRHRRRAVAPADAVTGGWAELVDVAVDLRHEPSSVDTRRESARVVGAGIGAVSLPGRLDDLAARADQAAFAPSPPSSDQVDEYWADVEETMTIMWANVGWRTRFAGRVSTRSLRRRDRRAHEQRTQNGPRNMSSERRQR
ncbi:MAG: transglutaminase domain-containing protein, partial [Micrococcales bacterium]|nr:transglutaminase domain-containing protein [Micrococcales bacterium]